MNAVPFIPYSTPKRSKYGAKKTVVDGIKFDSAKEARRYQELVLLLRANRIGNLERQPVYTLHAGYGQRRVRIGEYRADFRYVDSSGSVIVEDVKSKITAKLRLYVWKKKHVEAEHGIQIREV